MVLKNTKMRLTSKEKTDLNKFVKFLALKSTEIIVQSRLGEKISTPCKPNAPGTDWFNLNVNDIPEVLLLAKQNLNMEKLMSNTTSYCIEISLTTPETDDMVLETWSISLVPNSTDSNINNQTIYNRMGILLKSLVSVTRVTPAYKLSRRQGPDTYIILYQTYMDQPHLQCLGEGYKQVRIGQICTPMGTLQLSCAYRTKMALSPTQSSKGNSIMLKSDHFTTNLSSKNGKYPQSDDKTSSLSETMKAGAFADRKRWTAAVDPQFILPDVPFCTFFAERLSLNERNSQEALAAAPAPAPAPAPAAASPAASDPDDNKENNNAAAPHADQLTMTSLPEDFIMVDLKTPFAKPSGEKFELGKIFREWQAAPVLETFKELPPLEGGDIQKQLEDFESDLNEFDTIVQSLCQASPNNN